VGGAHTTLHSQKAVSKKIFIIFFWLTSPGAFFIFAWSQKKDLSEFGIG